MTISHKFLLAAAMLLGLLLVATDTNAGRLGGGRTSGASRAVATKAEATTPATATKAKTTEAESTGPAVIVRVRSNDSNSSASTPAASSAAVTQQPAPDAGSVAAAAVGASWDEEQARLRGDENARRQAEAAEKVRLEKEKRAAAIAAWEEYQAEQKKRQEKERVDREARNRARDGVPSQCVYKPVMTDQELEQCRQASR